ncbi:MAG: DUF599 domain-containing protein [archaeon]|nr:DUF599 domain-containing protein [archaeon]
MTEEGFDGWDLGEMAFFGVSYLAYHGWFGYLYAVRPHLVSLALNLSERRLWVRKVLSPTVNQTVGVQTIRNAIMSAAFFASTALLVSYSILSEMVLSEALSSNAAALSSLPYKVRVKLILFGILFLSAFLCFAFSLRSFGHLTFLINSKSFLSLPATSSLPSPPQRTDSQSHLSFDHPIPIPIPISIPIPIPIPIHNDDDHDDHDNIQSISQQQQQQQQQQDHHSEAYHSDEDQSGADLLQIPEQPPRTFQQAHHSCNGVMSRASLTWWLGMRCFYLTLPLGLWFLGFPGLSIGTILSLILLYLNDFHS